MLSIKTTTYGGKQRLLAHLASFEPNSMAKVVRVDQLDIGTSSLAAIVVIKEGGHGPRAFAE